MAVLKCMDAVVQGGLEKIDATLASEVIKQASIELTQSKVIFMSLDRNLLYLSLTATECYIFEFRIPMECYCFDPLIAGTWLS